MGETSAYEQGPIPPAKKDDTEDVAWALSTAEAMYARGDRSDALKWLRRAAESASEAEADDRALELAKAAADLATVVGPSVPPPPVVASSSPSAVPPPPAAPAPPAPSAVASGPVTEASTPLASSVEPSIPTQRTPQTTRVASGNGGSDGVPTPASVALNDGVQPPLRDDARDDLPDEVERTGTGVPAYEARAKMASEAPSKPALDDAPAQVAQAIRVVVWRTAGGVHVAPQGTKVAAITVDAMLVALDPSADLARWLSAK